MQSDNKYLLFVISLVVLFVCGMYVMKNVFHIKAYKHPSKAKAFSEHVSSTRPVTMNPAKKEEAKEVKEEAVIAEEESGKQAEKTEATAEPQVSTKTEIPDVFFKNLLETYKQEVALPLNGKNRSDIVIRYYPHEPDGDKVRSLRALNLYIHEREVDEALATYETNSLYYGDSVETSDIQLIAYTLLINGIRLKQIVPSAFHSDWKSRSVEVGADTALIDAPVLTLENIQSFRNDLLLR